MEMDDHIELVDEFRPTSLTAREEFGSCKILKVLMVYNNVNRLGQAF
jgi:hypothetical protein